MKKTKRILPILVTVALVGFLIPTSSADFLSTENFTDSNDITWTFDAINNEITLTDCSQKTGDIVAPAFFQIDDETILYIKHIGGVFTGSDITSITFDELSCIESFAYGAFSGCNNLTYIITPDTVLYIGESAFSDCSALETVVIGESVNYIGEDAFKNCPSLNTIDVSVGNPLYSSENGVLFDYHKNTLIKYPEGKTESIYEVPRSVTSIKNSAFDSCEALESIVIASSVTYIESESFKNCTGLKSIYFEGSVPSIQSDTFKNMSSENLTFYYHIGAEGWTSPTTIINGIEYNTVTIEPPEDTEDSAIPEPEIIIDDESDIDDNPENNNESELDDETESEDKQEINDGLENNDKSELSDEGETDDELEDDETQTSEEAESPMSIPIKPNAEPSEFRVIVPLSLPVHVNSAGVAITATNARVKNESSYGMVSIASIGVEGIGGWQLCSFYDDFGNKPVNSKKFGMIICGKTVNPINSLVECSDLVPLDIDEEMEFIYDVKILLNP